MPFPRFLALGTMLAVLAYSSLAFASERKNYVFGDVSLSHALDFSLIGEDCERDHIHIRPCLNLESNPVIQFDPNLGWGLNFGGGRYLHPLVRVEGTFGYSAERTIEGTSKYSTRRTITRIINDPNTQNFTSSEINFTETLKSTYESRLSMFSLLGWGIIESPPIKEFLDIAPLDRFSTRVFTGVGVGAAMVSLGNLEHTTRLTDFEEITTYNEMERRFDGVTNTIDHGTENWKFETETIKFNPALGFVVGVSQPILPWISLDFRLKLVNHGRVSPTNGEKTAYERTIIDENGNRVLFEKNGEVTEYDENGNVVRNFVVNSETTPSATESIVSSDYSLGITFRF